MSRILANTVLPARREPVTLETADGERLRAESALPAEEDPVATLVCVHPLPTHGGSMESHLLRKLAWRMPALAGLAVLRFNTRGTGGSTGSFDEGDSERFDLAAALDFAESRDLPALWWTGWSFGADLVLRHGRDPSVRGAVLVSPPLRSATPADLDAWAQFGRPMTAIVPEFDDYLRPAAARERFARVPQLQVVGVDGAKHLFVGYAERVLNEIVKRVVPGAFPLAESWPAQ